MTCSSIIKSEVTSNHGNQNHCICTTVVKLLVSAKTVVWYIIAVRVIQYICQPQYTWYNQFAIYVNVVDQFSS